MVFHCFHQGFLFIMFQVEDLGFLVHGLGFRAVVPYEFRRFVF